MPETIISRHWGKVELTKLVFTRDRRIDYLEEQVLKLEKDNEIFRSENLDQRNHIIQLYKKIRKLGQ